MYRDLLGAMRRCINRRLARREQAALTRKLDGQALGEFDFPVAEPKRRRSIWF